MRTEHLWQRLALVFIVVALSAIAAAYLILNYVIDTHFQGYVNQREKAVYQRIGLSLAAAYIDSGGWDNQLTEALPHFAIMNRIDIEIHDAQGNLIVKTPFGDDERQNQKLLEQLGVDNVYVVSKKRVVVPMVVRRRRVGFISVAPLNISGELTSEQRFRRSLNRSLVVGGMIATIVALLLSYIVSTRMTKPLVSMTGAAKKLEDGDFSQRVEVDREDEIGQLGEAFNHLAETLERQERMRKNLTADVAHELRTPLAVIRSHVEAYMDKVMEPDPENLQSIHEEIMRLGRLVNDLSELARAESGRLELERTDVDLGDVVDKVVAGLAPVALEKGITVDIETETGTLGCFDEDKLRQVVVNLVGNAIKFTPEGGRVEVRAFNRGPEVLVAVIDTGLGIAPEAQAHIFERFYRVDKSRNRATGGSGIGLTIADELVKLHGGHIEVESLLGEGSTFKVILPRNSKKNHKKPRIHNYRTPSS